MGHALILPLAHPPWVIIYYTATTTTLLASITKPLHQHRAILLASCLAALPSHHLCFPQPGLDTPASISTLSPPCFRGSEALPPNCGWFLPATTPLFIDATPGPPTAMLGACACHLRLEAYLRIQQSVLEVTL